MRGCAVRLQLCVLTCSVCCVSRSIRNTPNNTHNNNTHNKQQPQSQPNQVSAINTAMSSLIKTLGVFPAERDLVRRERRRASYALVPYLG